MGRSLAAGARRFGRRLPHAERIYGNVQWVRAYRGFSRKPVASIRFVLLNHETENFTYDLDNLDELCRTLEESLGVEAAEVRRVVAELQDDESIRHELRELLHSHGYRHRRPAYGRRLGWYAVARLRKPKLIVETGIDEGIGSAILLLALERNAAEGADGRLLAFDIRDDVGWLVPARLRTRYDIRIGDTNVVLPAAIKGETVDMFIHDSMHTYEHETFELNAVFPHTSAAAALISDNAHGSSAFTDFCARHNLQPWIFHEQPHRHMYPGAALGLALADRPARFPAEISGMSLGRG
jgi:hypothetical protein